MPHNPRYASFAADVLCHGAAFACKVAEQSGIPGATVAKWLARLSLKANRSPAVQRAVA